MFIVLRLYSGNVKFAIYKSNNTLTNKTRKLELESWFNKPSILNQMKLVKFNTEQIRDR